MRLILVATLTLLVSLPVAARPHKRTRARSHPAHVQQKIVPNDRAAQEHARAEAELSDLRAGRVSDGNDTPAAEPAQTWAVQENDREIPANLRQKQ